MIAYDSPVWFYVFMVPVFGLIAVAVFLLALSVYSEVKADR